MSCPAWVPADTDTGGNTDPHLLELVKSLVGQRAAPAHDAHRPAGQRDLAPVIPMLHLPGLIMPGQLGPIRRDKRSCGAARCKRRFVLGRDPFGYADNDVHTGLGCLQDRSRRHLGGHGDETGVGAGRLPGLRGRSKNGDSLDILAALGRVDAGHDLGAVIAVAQTVKRACPPVSP